MLKAQRAGFMMAIRYNAESPIPGICDHEFHIPDQILAGSVIEFLDIAIRRQHIILEDFKYIFPPLDYKYNRQVFHK